MTCTRLQIALARSDFIMLGDRPRRDGPIPNLWALRKSGGESKELYSKTFSSMAAPASWTDSHSLTIDCDGPLASRAIDGAT